MKDSTISKLLGITGLVLTGVMGFLEIQRQKIDMAAQVKEQMEEIRNELGLLPDKSSNKEE